VPTQTKDYYGTLGVKKSASAEEIRKVEPPCGRERGAAERESAGEILSGA
jgi:hypothetical protein